METEELVKKLVAAKWQNLDADILKELENPALRQELVNAMHTDDYVVRGAIAWALCQVGAPAKQDLLTALRDDDWRVRYAIAGILWLLSDTDVIPDLLIALHDPEPLVRMAAAETLAQIGDYSAVSELIQALNDEDGHVYTAAISALREIETDNDIPELYPYLTSDNIKLRMASAYILGAKGGINALKGMYEVVQYGFTGDRSEMERVTEEIINIGIPAVPDLLETLQTTNDETWGLRRMAVQVLGQLKDSRAVQPLIELLSGEDRDLQQDSMWALSNIGTAAIPALITLLDHVDEDVRRNAVEALEKITDPDLKETFLGLLEDHDPRIRSLAIFSFRARNGNDGIPKLIERLHDIDRGVQSAAAMVLEDFFATPEALAAVEQWRREQGRPPSP